MKKKKALWDKKFGKPLELALKRLEFLPEANSTPLLESIYTIATRFDFGKQVDDRKLVIISDLLHFTKNLSLYSAKVRFSKVIHSTYFEAIAPNLGGIDARVLHLRRPKNSTFQRMPHKNFWDEYFINQNAKSFDYIR